MATLARATTSRTKQIRRGVSLPACDSIYRYRESYKGGATTPFDLCGVACRGGYSRPFGAYVL